MYLSLYPNQFLCIFHSFRMIENLYRNHQKHLKGSPQNWSSKQLNSMDYKSPPAAFPPIPTSQQSLFETWFLWHELQNGENFQVNREFCKLLVSSLIPQEVPYYTFTCKHDGHLWSYHSIQCAGLFFFFLLLLKPRHCSKCGKQHCLDSAVSSLWGFGSLSGVKSLLQAELVPGWSGFSWRRSASFFFPSVGEGSDLVSGNVLTEEGLFSCCVSGVLIW